MSCSLHFRSGSWCCVDGGEFAATVATKATEHFLLRRSFFSVGEADGHRDQLSFDLNADEEQSLVLFACSSFGHAWVDARGCPFDGFSN